MANEKKNSRRQIHLPQAEILYLRKRANQAETDATARAAAIASLNMPAEEPDDGYAASTDDFVKWAAEKSGVQA